MQTNLSIIIPMYNEEDRINALIVNLENFRKNFVKYKNVEIIFVDDGSKDKTIEKIKQYKSSFYNIKIIENNHQGQMFSIFTGIDKSNYNTIITLEADLPVNLDNILNCVSLLSKYDLIIGTRFGGKKIIGKSFFRRVISIIYSILFQLFFKINVKDPQIGFKIFKKNSFERISKNINLTYDGLKSSQMVVLFFIFNFKLIEYPLDYYHKEGSKTFQFTKIIQILIINFIAFIDLIIKTKKLIRINKSLKNPFRF